jgi:hypothetical protein
MSIERRPFFVTDAKRPQMGVNCIVAERRANMPGPLGSYYAPTAYPRAGSGAANLFDVPLSLGRFVLAGALFLLGEVVQPIASA